MDATLISLFLSLLLTFHSLAFSSQVMQQAIVGTTPPSSSPTISLDNDGNSGAVTGYNPSFSYTVGGTCSNLLALIVTVVVADPGTPFDITSVTYNSVAMNQYSDSFNVGNGIRAAIYSLTTSGGLVTGSNTLATTLAGVPGEGSVTSAISLCGVNQSTPIESGTSTTGSSTNPSITFSTLSAGAWYVAVAIMAGGTTISSINDSATSIYTTDFSGDNGTAAAYKGPIATPGSVNPNFTATFSDPWVMNGVSIQP